MVLITVKPPTITTMRISRETLNQLDKYGKKGDSYEDIVKWLIQQTNKIKPA